jgi:hypothetical protein
MTSSTSPLQGERTGPQGLQGSATVGGFLSQWPGYSVPPAGRLGTYRLMRGNPTIAIARVAATAPIRAARWSYQSRAGGADERVAFIRDQLEPIRPLLVGESLRALDFGFQAFEKVYAVQGGRLVLRRLKPLSPEGTAVLIDRRGGAFAGLRQGEVTLPASKAFVFTYDGEPGDFYGRSRHENVRESAWAPWVDLLRRQGQYVNKAAGVVPLIEYPEGVSHDRQGRSRDNFELAEAVAQQLGQGHGVTMPNVLARYAEDMVRSGMDPAQLRAWKISFLETRAGHGSEFVQMMRHFESLMLRGWLVPERTVAEGSAGTRADAAEHADLALVVAQQVLEDLVRHVNWHVIDPLLALNFGPDARGSVWVEPAPLLDEQAGFLRELVQRVLTSNADESLLRQMLDVDALLERTGVPRKS